MARRSIVIEYEAGTLCWAVAERRNGSAVLVAAGSKVRADGEAEAAFLTTSLLEVVRPGERLTLLFAPGAAWVRRLTYPFADPRKIEAALELDLGSRLPVSLDGLTVAGDRPRREAGKTTLLAAAVPDALLEERLSLFEQAGLPVGRCELTPFAFARGVDAPRLVVWAAAGILSLALVEGDGLRDQVTWRLADGEEPVAAALRLACVLERPQGFRDLPVQLLGPAADGPQWDEALRDAGRERWSLPAAPDGGELTPELGAVALAALGQLHGPRDGSLNLRRGRFALRGGWQSLRRPLMVAALLGSLVLLVAGGTAWWQLHRLDREAQRLQQEGEAQFRRLFPEVTTVVDLSLQTEAQLRDLRRRAGATGDGKNALAVLRGVSERLPQSLGLVVREWFFTPGELRLAGNAESFEVVNRAARLLQESPLFGEVQVSDARAESTGKVSFRLLVPLRGEATP